MRFVFTVLLFLLLGLVISCGQGPGTSDTAPDDPEDPNFIRKNNGCSKEKYKEAELAAYQELLRARAEAARNREEKITEVEKLYKADKDNADLPYRSALNQCGSNSACQQTAKDTYDAAISKAQEQHSDGIFVAQGNEKTANEYAQEAYDAAVEKAKQLYCALGYKASGNAGGDTVLSGIICDLEKPFSVKTSNPFINPFAFEPSSGSSGTWKMTYKNGFAGDGSGKYTVEGTETEKTAIVLQGSATAHSHGIGGTGGGEVRVILSPLNSNEGCEE